MSRLTPGASYSYEKIDGVTYAQELSSTEKIIIGWDWSSDDQLLAPEHIRSKLDDIKEKNLWNEIRRVARTNVTLQKALDQCIIIHHLSKDNPKPLDWHPV
jgi:hypothetical protein